MPTRTFGIIACALADGYWKPPEHWLWELTDAEKNRWFRGFDTMVDAAPVLAELIDQIDEYDLYVAVAAIDND